MHFATFVLIGRDANPRDAVARALQPLDENPESQPRRDYLDRAEIERMAARYRIPSTDLASLARTMSRWRGCKGGVDARGLYARSTYDGDGRLDWYAIGGRWNGYIKGARHNVITARTLCRSRHLSACLPYHVVTPDGRWLTSQAAWRFGSPETADHRRNRRRWLGHVRRVLKRHGHCKVVCVDIHS